MGRLLATISERSNYTELNFLNVLFRNETSFTEGNVNRGAPQDASLRMGQQFDRPLYADASRNFHQKFALSSDHHLFAWIHTGLLSKEARFKELLVLDPSIIHTRHFIGKFVGRTCSLTLPFLASSDPETKAHVTIEMSRQVCAALLVFLQSIVSLFFRFSLEFLYFGECGLNISGNRKQLWSDWKNLEFRVHDESALVFLPHLQHRIAKMQDLI